MSNMAFGIEIDRIKDIARKAGGAIMEVYGRDFEVEIKEDNSPLTEADKASHDIIVDGLESCYPEIPILSEEGKDIPYDVRGKWERFWLVDPLDGTKEFIRRNDQFTVNIALIKAGVPVLGVVYVPVSATMYWGSEKGSFKQVADGEIVSIKASEVGEKVRVVASLSHFTDETKDFIGKKFAGKEYELVNSGSSLKLCLVAEGAADIYPRLAPTMEWDTAAAHAVVKNAGGRVYDYGTGIELSYNKENLLNPWFVVE